MKSVLLFILILTSVFLFPLSVLADTLPDRTSIGTVGIKQASLIILDHELVELTIPPNTVQSLDPIPVKATFWLKNPTNEDLIIPVAFPLFFEDRETGERHQYASNVQVISGGNVIDSSLEGESVSFRAPVPAHQTREFIITLEAPAAVSGALTFEYLLSSGLRWDVSVKERKIVIHYPHPIQDGWIEARIIDGEHSFQPLNTQGKDAVWIMAHEKSHDTLEIRMPLPAAAKKIIDLQAQALVQLADASVLRALTGAYRDIIYDQQVVPLFAITGSNDVEKRLNILRYYPDGKPKNVQQALELARFYSNNWHPLCEDLVCAHDWTDPKAYIDLVAFLRSRNWDVSMGAERFAAAELNQKNAEWVASRTDLFSATSTISEPIFDTKKTNSALKQVSQQKETEVLDKRWPMVGGGVFILLLVLGVWRMGKRI